MLAQAEKERLENRQRTFRAYHAETDFTPTPRYFKIEQNDRDDLDYWVYKFNYFEEDRLNQDWSNLPDLFSEEFPEEVKPYIVL